MNHVSKQNEKYVKERYNDIACDVILPKSAMHFVIDVIMTSQMTLF